MPTPTDALLSAGVNADTDPAYRRARNMGLLGQIMNLEPTIGAGRALMADASETREMEQRAAEREAARQQREAERAESAAWREQTQADLNAQRAESNAIARMAAGDRDLARDATAQAREDAAAARAEARRDQQRAQLAGRLQQENLPGVLKAAERFDQTMKRYPAGTDIPGIGAGENFIPTMFQGPEAQLVRSDLSGIANQLLRAQSGAAVTDPEFRRFLEGLATGRGVSEEVFRKRWPQVQSEINAMRDSLYAGYDPEVVQEYRQQYEGYSQRGAISDRQNAARPPGQSPGAPNAPTHQFNPQTGKVEAL
jgi:hypothetical protein